MANSSLLPLNAADSAWLRMENPTNLMTITGVVTLRERLDFERFRTLVEEKLLVHDRFRMRVLGPRGGVGRARWAEGDFSISDHVVCLELPAPADKETLQGFVGREMGTPLDHSKPLWKFFFIENFLGGSALVARIHHCIGDGVSLMRVVLGMADPLPGEAGIAEVGIQTAIDRDETRELAKPSKVREALRQSGAATKALARLLAMRADPKTVLKGDLGMEKLVSWSDQISLDDVKFIGRRLGGTVNDVLMAAATGALRIYLRGRDEKPDGLDLRAVVPVNLRRPDDTELCNKFGLVYLSLPVGLRGRIDRLRELKRRMDALKRSPEAFVIYGMLKAFGMTNAAIQSKVVNLLSKNATAVMTNVPGPRAPLAFCGKEIDHFMFWVPQSGRLGLGVSILSYNDQVRIGVTTDRNLVSDPEAIVQGFHTSLEKLMEAARASEKAT
jgi:WS/DGAT/MGAT family acyltransferase